ncbi:MAG: hypothetical protein ACPGPF_04580 [Pontibacterium sp.]
MDILPFITGGLLVAGALFLAALFLRGAELPACSDTVFGLSLIFIAIAQLGEWLLSGSLDQDISTLNRMLQNLALFTGIPLISSTVFVAAFAWNPDKPAWGRWLLALLALFEVTRRAEAGTEYQAIMIALCALALLLPALKGNTRLIFPCIGASLSLALSQWSALQGYIDLTLFNALPSELSPLFLIVSLALSAYVLLNTLKTNQARYS